KEAKAEVSLQVEDVPLETAVRLLSEMAGLKPVRVGNTLFVTRKEIAAEMRNDPDFAPQGQPGTLLDISSVQKQQQFLIGNTVAVPGQFALPANPAGAPILAPPPPPPPAPPGVAPAAPPQAETGAATPVPPASEVKKSIEDGDKTPSPEKK